MSQEVILTYDKWVEKFKPIANIAATARGEEAAFDGTMFETYGDDLEAVRQTGSLLPERIWTLIDGDEGQVITNGFHIVNRVGYFICAESVDPKGPPFFEVTV